MGGEGKNGREERRSCSFVEEKNFYEEVLVSSAITG